MAATEEQEDFRKAVRAFCGDRVGTAEQRADLTRGGIEPHNPDVYAEMADAGWVGVGIPEEYGGSGGTLVDKMVLFEEVNRGMAPVSALGPSHIIAGIYGKFGTEEQKKTVLGAISSGRVVSISISEPEAGSDVANVSCRAEHVDGGFRINGQKTWCTAAHHADRILVVTRTGERGRGHRGLTLIEVPADAEGLEIRGIPTLAGREVNDLYFTDVVVGEENVVGTVDDAWAQIMAGLDEERLLCAAQGLGIAQRAFEDTLAYVTERKQFGRPIGSFQALRHRLADVATEIEASRFMTYEVAERLTAGDLSTTERSRLASMAKVKTSEVARHAALEGMQMMGGYGYSTEFDMERHLRAALILPIFAGTNEIQRDIIARAYGLKEPKPA
ncbi:acyl-CoA dehydrogenase family protein [Actinomycetospora sp. TBRC 11914]|uniref:acyl-CoA dehydrogenase family protein n=1 Tax=Actinomycetospora sp. TBRC 11914 TaxID=2729387 RepID=UPI00145CE9FC|nr:acyl-CoA dehydrogenase family protein [Actinomycetospora sp. TBRC 11914]NMO91665.1 acyl-CoA/acyl-ACP dehydrogenase [Actinomycetospora sp. TBRC 11914]